MAAEFQEGVKTFEKELCSNTVSIGLEGWGSMHSHRIRRSPWLRYPDLLCEEEGMPLSVAAAQRTECFPKGV